MKQSSVIILVIVGVVVLLGLALLTCIGLGAAMWLVGRNTEAPPPVFLKPLPPSSEPGPPYSEPTPPPTEQHA